MTQGQSCERCSASTGCTARHTDQRVSEEVAAGPYLLIAGVIIVVFSVILKVLVF